MRKTEVGVTDETRGLVQQKLHTGITNILPFQVFSVLNSWEQLEVQSLPFIRARHEHVYLRSGRKITG